MVCASSTRKLPDTSYSIPSRCAWLSGKAAFLRFVLSAKGRTRGRGTNGSRDFGGAEQAAEKLLGSVILSERSERRTPAVYFLTEPNQLPRSFAPLRMTANAPRMTVSAVLPQPVKLRPSSSAPKPSQRGEEFSLASDGNSQRLHLAVEVAALQAQNLGRAADVALVFFELAQDIVALISGARLLES